MQTCSCVGCGEYGREFEGLSHVVVIPQYNRKELPGVLRSIRPDLGLLLSVVPETFSYTLQELKNLAIPPVATRIGSFADRIEDGVNGFLCEAEPAAVVARLEQFNLERGLLAAAHEHLLGCRPRDTQEMVEDYERVLGLPALSARAYFNREQEPVTTKGSVDFGLTWRAAGGDFGEPVRGHGAAGATGSQIVSISIPELGASPSQLRLDIGQEVRFVVLFRMHLYSLEQQCVWSWDSRQDEPGGIWENVWPLPAGPGLLLYLVASGSRWLLPVGEADLKALEHGGRLEIEFSRPTIETLISGFSSLIFTNQAGQITNHQRETLRQLLLSDSTGSLSTRGTSSALLLQRLTDAEVRVGELETSLSWRITEPLRWAGTKALRFSRRMRYRVAK